MLRYSDWQRLVYEHALRLALSRPADQQDVCEAKADGKLLAKVNLGVRLTVRDCQRLYPMVIELWKRHYRYGTGLLADDRYRPSVYQATLDRLRYRIR